VNFRAPKADYEAHQYANQLLGAFREAGWSSSPTYDWNVPQEWAGRVTVSVAEKPHPHPCTKAVQEALVAVGVTAVSEVEGGEWEVVVITVGAKR
jgi:hypothetical protein